MNNITLGERAGTMRKAGAVKAGIMLVVLMLPVVVTCSWLPNRIPTRNYYIINYTPSPEVPDWSGRPYPYSLQIGRFDIQRIFDRQNIVYRYSPHQIQFYELERWAVRPDDMFRDMIFTHVSASNIVNRVALEFLDNRPDYRLEGSVEVLEKLDAQDLFYAHLGMSFVLIDVSRGQQMWDYSFDVRRQVYSPEMVQTVQTMSSIFQEQMRVVVSQMDSLFYSIQLGELPPPIPEAERQEEGESGAAPPPESSEDLDTESYEIIPER